MAKKKLIPLTPKQHAQLLEDSEKLLANVKNLEERFNNQQEIFKSEEQGYLNRITNLECSLEDSFEDNERLQTVISTLGGGISVLEKTNRINVKRFRRNNSNYATNYLKFHGEPVLTSEYTPDSNYQTADFKYDLDTHRWR